MKKIVGLFLILFSVNGYCGWTPTGDGDGYSGFIDSSTVKRNGSYVRAWELLNFKNEKEGSIVVLNEYDCKEERVRILSFVSYSGLMGQGSVKSTSNRNESWTHIAPNSKDSFMLNALCKHKSFFK